jgi:hypothetical protein
LTREETGKPTVSSRTPEKQLLQHHSSKVAACAFRDAVPAAVFLVRLVVRERKRNRRFLLTEALVYYQELRAGCATFLNNAWNVRCVLVGKPQKSELGGCFCGI